MKNDWLTIPDAPNYEINSQLICRNKKTGYILKKHLDKRKKFYYGVRNADGKPFCRSPNFLRRVAKAAVEKNSFEPIPSLGGRYEINERGVVRNAVTKQIITPKAHGKGYCFQIGQGNYFSRATADLLWEVHGQIIQRRCRPQPVIIENAHGKFFFPNCRACARWLAPKVFLAVSSICGTYFKKRRTQLGEWKISYPPRDLSGDIKWNAQGLAMLANRQAKLEKELIVKK